MFEIKSLIAAIAVGTVAGSLLIGCSSASNEEESAATKESANTNANVPETLFVGGAPTNAVPLIDAKTSAAVGDTVTFEARVGGKVDPFVTRFAMFEVVDSSLKSCDQIPGDNCKFPWDYCCEPKDNLLKHKATIQVVDADGEPVAGSLKDVHGLTGGVTVFVSGTVRDKNDDGVFLIDATAIHVASGTP